MTNACSYYNVSLIKCDILQSYISSVRSATCIFSIPNVRLHTFTGKLLYSFCIVGCSHVYTKYTHCIIIVLIPRFASTGFDNVSGTSWTGLKSVSTSQLVPSWGRTIRCVDGRHYGEVLHEYQSQESTTLFCSVIPCHTAHWHIYIVCMMQREIPSRLAPRLIYKES